MNAKDRYMPHTEEDRAAMLAAIGVRRVEDLFADIPEDIRFKGALGVSERLGEQGLVRRMRELAARNADFERHACFLGAGIYDHFIPSVVRHVLSRSEFYTAYTPYQPEISQGELQAIFEFQSMICELTGMAVANASMYDGATAMAEAGKLAAAATRRNRLVLSGAVHPETRDIVRVTARGLGLAVTEVGCRAGATDPAALEAAVGDDVAAVLVQSPNFFGSLESLGEIGRLAKAAGALFVVSANPLSLGVLEAPGAFGADIVVGDAQPIGIAASLGGPTCGYFAAAEPWMRRIPGRIVGQTVDRAGARGFVLTLQTREQHIRREKATSNICSNQALLALAAAVYLSVMGKAGFAETARRNLYKARHAADRLAGVSGVKLAWPETPFFNEFVLALPDGTDLAQVNARLLERGYIGGYDLGRAEPELAGHMLVAVTEQRTREEIDGFAAALAEILEDHAKMEAVRA